MLIGQAVSDFKMCKTWRARLLLQLQLGIRLSDSRTGTLTLLLAAFLIMKLLFLHLRYANI